jgi:hypothetical protein
MAPSILAILSYLSTCISILRTSNAFLLRSRIISPSQLLPSTLTTRQGHSSDSVVSIISFHYPTPFCSKNKRLLPSRTSRRLHRKESTLFAIPYDSSLADISLIVSIALIIGVAAQGFINSMVTGDRGLGAFLSDGSGFNRSNFKPVDKKSKYGDNAPLSGTDPLPWLKLPKLSYVEVAGQVEKEVMLSEDSMREILESLANKILYHIKNGELELAKETEAELERRLEEFGFEYNTRKGA